MRWPPREYPSFDFAYPPSRLIVGDAERGIDNPGDLVA